VSLALDPPCTPDRDSQHSNPEQSPPSPSHGSSTSAHFLYDPPCANYDSPTPLSSCPFPSPLGPLQDTGTCLMSCARAQFFLIRNRESLDPLYSLPPFPRRRFSHPSHRWSLPDGYFFFLKLDLDPLIFLPAQPHRGPRILRPCRRETPRLRGFLPLIFSSCFISVDPLVEKGRTPPSPPPLRTPFFL